jgi:hypothetical protein
MTPDNNEVHFLTNVTILLIPQRMNSFNKEAKVNFVKWYYSGLSFACLKQHFLYSIRATNSKLDMSNKYHTLSSLVVTSVTLPSCCYFDKFFNSFFHYCVLLEDVKKKTRIGNHF